MATVFDGWQPATVLMVLLLGTVFSWLPIGNDPDGEVTERGGMPFAAFFGVVWSFIPFMGWFGQDDPDPGGALIAMLIFFVVAVGLRLRARKRLVSCFSMWVLAAGCSMCLLVILGRQ